MRRCNCSLGSSALHGFAAVASISFGVRDELTSMKFGFFLVGMVKGSSLYIPEVLQPSKARRNIVCV